ncbi:MAG: efflux RND transporter periplasmic adaptor subunit [Endozoicomonas sp. (ex Botrylloides leachii)]|nr:efflux RND transporter periplasmic adaptor subunit [Endozoicomonas sp. (ex Botrylloides leachii)]
MPLDFTRRLAKTLCITLLTLGLPCFANAEPPPKKPAPINIETATTEERSVPVTLTSIGTLYAQEDTELSFGGEGHLVKIRFPEGSAVKKGNIIAVLDSSSASAELASADARLIQARSDYERYQLVKDKNVFSEQEQVSIKTALEEAKSNKKIALSTLENLQLRAPYDGVLGSYNYDLGTFISAGTPLVRLVNIASLEVKYSLAQQNRNDVKLGQGIELTTAAVPNHVFKGVVIYVAPTVDPSTGRFDLKARINNRARLLSPGFSANIRQFLGKKRHILVVPQAAIVADGSNYFVFQLTTDNHVERKMVTIGDNTNDGFTEIKTGLKQGDIVATAGKERLKNGSPITITNTPAHLNKPSDKIPNDHKATDTTGNSDKTSNHNEKTPNSKEKTKIDKGTAKSINTTQTVAATALLDKQEGLQR